jgi:hypothetical protein
MDNFYNMLDVPFSASEKQIILGYKNKISIFRKIPNLTIDHIRQIKILKTALFILTTQPLRHKYNILINQSIKYNPQQQPPPPQQQSPPPPPQHQHPERQNKEDGDDFNPMPSYGDDGLNDMDSVFNVDNSWMKNVNVTKDVSKKNKFESNSISDRVFSLPQFAKKQDYPSELGDDLRIPQQGRVDKTQATGQNNAFFSNRNNV